MHILINFVIFSLPKRFLTLAAPTPTNISSNSEPEQKKKGTPASPATAFANNVLPVPGAPISRTPNRHKTFGTMFSVTLVYLIYSWCD